MDMKNETPFAINGRRRGLLSVSVVVIMSTFHRRLRGAALNRPVLVGEWYFGALDVGLPATGIGAVRDQAARGKAFRIYTEDAAEAVYVISPQRLRGRGDCLCDLRVSVVRN